MYRITLRATDESVPGPLLKLMEEQYEKGQPRDRDLM